ncbi:MAG: hypothetical protein DRR16_23535 [Candidatus Parabeggiatoa sp. nov. 3]|nr:MAG: hypothetical protein DRR00_26845 [Gammaproteobacteria bacterium]RKZ59341.1 MAG: hypothetical protein DRQ99_23880 [Gammaproteobacteria bacterium]RKZ80634.1 MAG: hypothetical protein DRR16_23535 [Gammaproteobacteria bacterium]
MGVYEIIDKTKTSSPILQELSFLTEQTGQDEATLIAQALPLGLNLLYRQVAEQVFIAGTLPRENALTILGDEKVERLEYLQHAFPQDISGQLPTRRHSCFCRRYSS